MTQKKAGLAMAKGVVEASDPKAPGWVKKPLDTRGGRTLVVGNGVSETKGEAKSISEQAAAAILLEQVGKLVRPGEDNETVFADLFDKVKGKPDTKPQLLAAALETSPLKIGEADATYWEKRRPDESAAAEYHYFTQLGTKLESLAAAKGVSLKHKTSFGVRTIPFFPLFSRGFGVPAGVVVSKLKKGSAAQKAGIRPADAIVRIGGKAISDIKGFAKVMKKAAKKSKKTGPFDVEIVRIEAGGPKKLTVQLSK